MASGLSLSPLSHAPVLRDRVYEQLEELIISGALVPGQRLLEAELADQLDVSRNPVREALTMLAQGGWVDHRPRQGAVVHQPSSKEIEDFFQIRRVLEAEAGRLAAANATDEAIAAMEAVVRDGRESLESGDDAAVAQCNSRFHQLVKDAADNRVLDEMLGRIEKRLRWYFAPVARVRGHTSWDEHAELVLAIAARDGDRAAEILVAHSEATASSYRALSDGDSAAESE